MNAAWPRTKWPWITVVVALVAAFLPPISDAFQTVLYSGEQLARTLSELILWVFAGIVCALALIEWGIRWYVARRRASLSDAALSHPAKES